jgi:hypothetical protein
MAISISARAFQYIAWSGSASIEAGAVPPDQLP